MSLEQTTELYASVLRQLLPEGVYDTAEMTHVADDIYAHAKALAQADIDTHRLLQVLETIPVDLLADYEREYGLPMQCMVPGSQTIEERISVLRWIRQHRNVMNREYLEQILAIFGVTLVDVIKHRPMLCTAPCTSPVNTERLRYKVLLRLQYPMTADMSCIIENYLAGYLMIEWVVDMPWGDWILNPEVTVNTNGVARYTAYKTNQREYYDSYANLDLTAAIVRSLHDADMQQWQAVKDAINSLIGTTSYSFNNSTSSINYLKGYIVLDTYAIGAINRTPTKNDYDAIVRVGNYVDTFSAITAVCQQMGGWRISPPWTCIGYSNQSIGRTDTDAFSKPGTSESLSYSLIAQKIISNVSSSNQAISLLAEAYLEAVASSIFNTDPSKQFVKLSDLLSQFELNKTLRT